MEIYKIGDILTIPSLEELQSLGWFLTKKDKLTHDDLDSYNYNMNADMMAWLGKTVTILDKEGNFNLTLDGEDVGQLYSIKEDNAWAWCFPLFNHQFRHNDLIKSSSSLCISHVEGITPIFGWFICKNCGTDLREVK